MNCIINCKLFKKCYNEHSYLQIHILISFFDFCLWLLFRKAYLWKTLIRSLSIIVLYLIYAIIIMLLKGLFVICHINIFIIFLLASPMLLCQCNRRGTLLLSSQLYPQHLERVPLCRKTLINICEMDKNILCSTSPP